jgi:hypothetical protein
MKRRLKAITISAAVLLGVMISIWFSVFPFLTIRTALVYPLLHRLCEAESIVHFPNPVPKGANPAGFYFNAGAMQAATEMELRLSFRPQEYSRELARLKGFSVTSDGEQFLKIYEKKWFRTVRKDQSSFQIRVLHCRPTFYGKEPSWNHGNTYGYAWNEADKEVIYWTSSW